MLRSLIIFNVGFIQFVDSNLFCSRSSFIYQNIFLGDFLVNDWFNSYLIQPQKYSLSTPFTVLYMQGHNRLRVSVELPTVFRILKTIIIEKCRKKSTYKRCSKYTFAVGPKTILSSPSPFRKTKNHYSTRNKVTRSINQSQAARESTLTSFTKRKKNHRSFSPFRSQSSAQAPVRSAI